MNDTPKRGAPEDVPQPGRDDTQPEEPGFSHGGTGRVPEPKGGGISNPSIDEEQRSQDVVPERGHRRDE